ncbi:MAG TPA: branched-chain amino acid ABC transporter permease [Casimicrobiaceae bacterium]|nr:branched-chain amino acid ABC transporter permease [Casimicrobiaceae bacterium]
MTGQSIINQFFLGLSTASIYVLVSLGLTMIFGMMNVLNFTHGVLYALGAYFGYLFATLTGNFWFALVAAPACVALIGVVIERTAIRPLSERRHLIQFLATYGVALVIEQVIRIVAGNDSYPVALPSVFAGSLSVGSVRFPAYRVFIVAAATFVCVALGALLGRTRIGALIRAVSEDPEMAALLRVNTGAVSTFVFAGGSALAALGGVLAAPIFSVYPSMGEELITVAFLVVTAGGLGSVGGTILASLVIGEAGSLGLLAVGKYSDVLAISLMAAVFVVFPAGIFGGWRRA